MEKNEFMPRPPYNWDDTHTRAWYDSHECSDHRLDGPAIEHPPSRRREHSEKIWIIHGITVKSAGNNKIYNLIDLRDLSEKQLKNIAKFYNISADELKCLMAMS